MVIKFKVKKTVSKGVNKDALLEKFKNSHVYSAQYGETRLGTKFIDGIEHVMVYTLQKFNKKTSQTKVDSKGGSPFPKTTKSKLIREKHWEITIHYIPVPLLVLMGKKVKQNDRTFWLVSKTFNKF